MTKRHVLMVPSSYPRARAPGEGIFYRDQARALVRSGWQLGVAFPEFLRWREGHMFSAGAFQSIRATREDEDGVVVFRTQIWNPPLRRLRAARWTRVATRLIAQYVEREGRPDVIHAQGFLWGGLAAARMGASLGIPVVVTEHSSRFPRRLVQRWEARLVAEALPSINAIIAVSESLAAALRPFTGNRMIEVIPNLVDVEFFYPRSGSPAAPRPVTFLTIASLDHNKGIDVLLKSFAALPSGLNTSRLQIVGDGTGRRAFERLAIELGVSGRVVFLGQRDRVGVREAIWGSDVFVLASRVETFGVALIEAMACGLPVVATRSGGPDGTVEPSSGWMVPPGDIAQLSAAMVEAAAARTTFDRAGARRVAVERFSEAVVSRRLIEVYTAALPGSSIVAN